MASAPTARSWLSSGTTLRVSCQPGRLRGRARGGAPAGHAPSGRLWPGSTPSGLLFVASTASQTARPRLHTSLRQPVRFRPQGAHAHAHLLGSVDSSGRGEGGGVARVGSAPPSEGCHYVEPGKRGRARAPPGPGITRKQVSERVGLAGSWVSTAPARTPAAHAHAQHRLRSSLGPAPG